MKVFSFTQSTVLSIVALLVFTTLTATAQIPSGYAPYDTTTSTNYQGGSQTTPTTVDPNFLEMNLRTLMGIRRLEIKGCVDQLAIRGQDSVLTYLADKMDLAEDDSGWLRITDFYTFAKLSALNILRGNLKILAGKKLRPCNLKPVDDAQAIAAQNGAQANPQSPGGSYTPDSLSTGSTTPGYNSVGANNDFTFPTTPTTPATPGTDSGTGSGTDSSGFGGYDQTGYDSVGTDPTKPGTTAPAVPTTPVTPPKPQIL